MTAGRRGDGLHLPWSKTAGHARRASSLAAVYEGLAKGQSLQVPDPHRFLPPDHPLQGMVASLERTLGQPLTLGAIFLSPAGAQGLVRHHDVLDLFTLQLAGRKRWHLFERLPRGIPHEVLAADETSLSVGLGFRPATWAMILERVTAALLKAPEFAPPVPPRAEETLDQERIRAMVHALRARLDALEPDHVREALADLSLASGPPPEAEPHLEQALSAAVVEADAWLRKRRGMQARVRTQGEQVRLDFSGGEGVAAPLAAQPTLAALVDCQHAFRPCDLPGPLRAEAGDTANVACMTLAESMRRYGRPYYLKIDLEGFDSEAAAQLADCPYRPRWLSMEGGHPEDIERLAEFGYRRFALVNQKDVPAESDRWLAAEGQALRYPFPYGASGPFGNDLAQDWLTAEQAIDARRCLTRARLSAIEAELPDLARARAAMLAFGWYDLHAGP